MQMEVHPYLAECFYNHGGTVMKCYAIEEQLFVRAKPSIPDIHRPAAHASRETDGTQDRAWQGYHGEAAFHTLTNMPCAESDSVHHSLADDQLTMEAAQLCAATIRAATGLTLFGFDLTKPAAERFLLVDVNAFPSFRGIPGAAEALREFFKHRCKR